MKQVRVGVTGTGSSARRTSKPREGCRMGRSRLRPPATFQDGLRELVLCERILESKDDGAWVRV